VTWFASPEGRTFLAITETGLELRAMTGVCLARVTLPCQALGDRISKDGQDSRAWAGINPQAAQSLAYLSSQEPDLTLHLCDSVLLVKGKAFTLQASLLEATPPKMDVYLAPRTGFFCRVHADEMSRALAYLDGTFGAESSRTIVVSSGVAAHERGGYMRLALGDGVEQTFVDVPLLYTSHDLFCFAANPKLLLAAVESCNSKIVELTLAAPIDHTPHRDKTTDALCLRPWQSDHDTERLRWIVQTILLSRTLKFDRGFPSPAYREALAQAGLMEAEPD
jgi:hypothetical protein